MSIINKPPETVKREYELQEPVAIWKDPEFRRWRKQQQAKIEHQKSAVSSQAAKA